MTFIPKLENYAMVSSTALLAPAFAEGASSWFDVELYESVVISSFADVPGTITVDWSPDNGATLVQSITYSALGNQPFYRNIPRQSRYFRIQYTNGPSPQGARSFEAFAQTGVDLVEYAPGDNPTGQPVGNRLRVDSDQNLLVSVVNPTSTFGDLRTVQLTPQFQGTFEYTVDNTDLNTNTVSGSGTITQANGMAVVGSGTTIGSDALLTSTFPARYRAGLGGVCRFTARFTAGSADTAQLVGLADERGATTYFKNGYVIGYDGATFGVHRFKNDTITTVALSACDDPLDGTGRSGMAIQTQKLNVFFIAYQYLGAGDIYFYVEDKTRGRLVLFHTIKYAGDNDEPSTLNPNFKYSMFVDNKTTALDKILRCASYAYFVEGLTKYFEVHQPQKSSGKVQKLTVTSQIPIFTIRNKSLYNGYTNFIDVLIELVSGSSEAGGNNLAEIRLVKNGDITTGTPPSYNDINTNNSVMEIDTTADTIVGGTVLGLLPLAGANDKGLLAVTAFDIIIHPGETLTITGESSNSATLNAFALWKELF